MCKLSFFAAVMVFGIQAWQTSAMPGGLAPNADVPLLQPDGTFLKSTLRNLRALHPGQTVALHF